MNRIALPQFADILGGTLYALPEQPQYVANISVHSGRIPQETAFFALSGNMTDGHRYVADAFANGAVVAVVARDWYERAVGQPDGPLIVVPNPLAALQSLAGWWRRSLTGRVVGITGSNSKTMVKDALHQALSTAYRCAASPGSFNSQLGVPLALLRTPDDAQYALLEVGISAPGEMARLESMVQPDYGILTNVRWAHIAEFGSRERIAAEKAQLFAHIPPSGWTLLPAEDPLADRIAEGLHCRVYRYGADTGDLPAIRSRRNDSGEIVFDVRFPNGEEFSLPVGSLLPNVAVAIETAIHAGYLLGVPATQLAAALARYRPRTTRLEVWKSPNGVTLIHASDNPDPLAVQTELRELETRSVPGGRRLFLLGGMGDMMDAEYAEVGALGAQHGVDNLLLVGNPKLAATETTFLARSPAGRAHRFTTLAAAREHLLADLKWGDTLLVKGSGLTGIDSIARDIVEAMAPNRFYLDLKAIAENVSRIRRLVGPRTRILAMLKALAYGSDAVQLSRGLQQMGMDQIGVSSADEGRQLRQAGVELPILVMMCTPDEVDKLTRYDLTPMIYSFEIAAAIVAAVGAQQNALDVHLEVDTGMGRLGVEPGQVSELVALIASCSCLRLCGVMTHFAGADMPEEDEATRMQLARFLAVRARLETLGYTDLIYHAAATAGAIRFPEARLDMVRIGLGLFGVYPGRAWRRRWNSCWRSRWSAAS